MANLLGNTRRSFCGTLADFQRRRRRLARGSVVLMAVCICFHYSIQPVCSQTTPPHSEVQLTTAAAVHDLPVYLAPSPLVHLRGTITYYDADNHVLFLQDQSGGVFIKTDHPYGPLESKLVDVRGQAQGTYRTSVAMDPAITVVGKGATVKAVRSTFQDLVTGSRDCRLVTIRGRVRAAEMGLHENAPSVHLDVAMPDGEVEVYVRSPDGFDPEALLDATVEVTGVAGGAFDPKWQLSGVILYVSAISAIHIQQPPSVSINHLPSTDIDNVFESQRLSDSSRRLRVSGTLTYYKPGTSAVIEERGKSIFIQTRDTARFELGDVIDAIGFASDREYAPSLREAFLRKIGQNSQIRARPTTFSEAISGTYSDNLISLSGKLVSQLYDSGADTLVLDVDGHLVSGFVSVDAPFRNLEPGSQVRLVGICRIVPGASWDKPNFFHLDLRDRSDVQLLATPSWWTVRHLVILLAAVTLIALSIAAWAIVLRRRVLQQSSKITRSMAISHERSRILEMISSNVSQEVLLSEICALGMKLLPGTACSRYTSSSEFPPQALSQIVGIQSTVTFFLFPLSIGEGEWVDELRVSGPPGHLLSNDSKDVFSTLEELAALAMQQSVLHERLVYHSTHDALTNLPNRRLFETRLAEAIRQAELLGSRFSVIYIDVNRFKPVNDTYGHQVGDLYLKQISARLASKIRATDTLARVGGDEFIVVASPLADQSHISGLPLRLQECFEEPFDIEGTVIDGSASFGAACYPIHGVTADDLKRHADHAMYLDKQMHSTAPRGSTDMTIVSPEELQAALLAESFWLAYQPQFSSDGRITGLEALLRLEDSILGTVTPSAFISVAERSDLIHDLGAWVLARALQDAVRWKLHTGAHMVIAVNVSVRQLERADFAAKVIACLEENAFPADRLELELVERSLTPGAGLVEGQLTKLRAAGVRISLDDFGTDQSCLSRLHQLPIDTIKLDRSFVAAMDDDPAVLPIIRAIAVMGKSLGKRIVAEGVEHIGPVSALLSMDITQFQGFLLGRPLASAQISELLPAWRTGITLPYQFQQRF